MRPAIRPLVRFEPGRPELPSWCSSQEEGCGWYRSRTARGKGRRFPLSLVSVTARPH